MLTEIEEFVSSVDKSYRSLMREPQDINYTDIEENKDPIDLLSDYFGGTKIELAMTTLQLLLSKLRDKDSKRE